MDKKYSDCDIVLDLLPLYIDEKTGVESNDFIKNHVAWCMECQEVYQLMNGGFLEEATSSMKQEKDKEQKKKRRRHRWKRLAMIVAGLVGYICLMIGIVVFMFYISTSDY